MGKAVAGKNGHRCYDGHLHTPLSNFGNCPKCGGLHNHPYGLYHSPERKSKSMEETLTEDSKQKEDIKTNKVGEPPAAEMKQDKKEKDEPVWKDCTLKTQEQRQKEIASKFPTARTRRRTPSPAVV